MLLFLLLAIPAWGICPPEKVEIFADVPTTPDIYNRNLLKVHFEGDELWLCTTDGIYSIDLEDAFSLRLVGFKGCAVQDYVKSGNTIIASKALTGETYNTPPFAYVSHDNGQTFADYNPAHLLSNHYYGEYINCISALAQNPANSEEILMLSTGDGLYRSLDFGRSWECLDENYLGNPTACFLEYHPRNPSTILFHGETGALQGMMRISRDGGDSWEFKPSEFHGDNCIHQVAFHPTNDREWVYGGEGILAKSSDAGANFPIVADWWEDHSRSAYYYNVEYDTGNPDIVYAAGIVYDIDNQIRVAVSTDGGDSWNLALDFSVGDGQALYNGISQTAGYLYFYSYGKLYRVAKKELIQGYGSSFNPQPASNAYTVGSGIVRFAQEVADLEICTIDGRIICRASNCVECSIVDFPAGVYVIRYSLNGSSFSGKIILR